MEPRRFIIYFSLQTFSFVFASKVLTEELFEIPRRVCLFWKLCFYLVILNTGLNLVL